MDNTRPSNMIIARMTTIRMTLIGIRPPSIEIQRHNHYNGGESRVSRRLHLSRGMI